MNKHKIKAVIVDDNSIKPDLLVQLVRQQFPEIELVASFESALEAEDFLKADDIDLLFLDIKVPDKSGMDLAKIFEGRAFEIIFVTDYEKYALYAYANYNIEFILKPLSPKVFKQIVNKTLLLIQTKYLTSPSLKRKERFLITTDNGMRFVNPSEVLYIEAQGAYSIYHFTDNTKNIVSSNLLAQTKLLEGHMFYRIHNSFLVNLDFLKSISNIDNLVILKNDGKLPISRRRKRAFIEYLKSI